MTSQRPAAAAYSSIAAAGAVADGERRADRIGLVEVVEEEAPRPERRRREARNRRHVAVRPAVAGDVHGGDGEARRPRPPRRSSPRPSRGGRGSCRRSCRGSSGASRPRGWRRTTSRTRRCARSLAMPPDEVRDVVDVRVRAGRDRRQADGRQRRERRDAPGGTSPRRRARKASARERSPDRVLERRRRQAVDDDQDRLALTSQACGAPAYFSPARCRERSPTTGIAIASTKPTIGMKAERRRARRLPTRISRGSAWSAAAPHGAARERSRAEAAERARDRADEARLPVEDEPADHAAADERDERLRGPARGRTRERAAGGESERGPDPGRDADQPDLVHEGRSVVSCASRSGEDDCGGTGPDSHARLLYALDLRPRAADGESARARRAQGARPTAGEARGR